MTILTSIAVFLAAAVIAVPLFKRLRLGGILGYLVAGVIIGPFALNIIGHPETILHFAELGVVLLLFIIGLELEPQKLWRMRYHICLSGGGQLITSAAVLGVACFALLSLSSPHALVIGLAVALSSTAFAIQLMKEQRIFTSPPGQLGFAMLLMQDLAVIPILLLVAGLAKGTSATDSPWWLSVMGIVSVLIAGRYLLNPFLRVIARYGSEEIMTAASLLIVAATALAMQQAGLSMGMGAFVAGMLLANSNFKHQLEAEIEPFKGLLLGLFFIAIGMNLDMGLLIEKPAFIVACSIALIVIKTSIIFVILKFNKQTSTDALRIGLMLSQGGEFAFVVMTQATGNGLLDATIANQVTLVVGISMALTSPMVILYSNLFHSKHCPRVYDDHRAEEEPRVIIAGFGRFGQISARILAANHIPFTALDINAEHIEFVNKFGNKVFYGDATKRDLLKKAGIEEARVLLIAVDDQDAAITIAKMVKEQFPDIHIVARARNRTMAIELHRLEVSYIVRELWAGSLEAADFLLQAYGYSENEADRMISIFSRHDQELLDTAKKQQMGERELIKLSGKGRAQLESLFNEDAENLK
ncbi:monovalent cation:proton antiporter-2 (CPA2) family protein [Alteromonas ponticola]|uniref:Monovalent cation:proton antiporter-2 (CPA2) family protein n=1 Tax=Alteromonas aquimaris TaxID=2998417 RepID=A0ABT3P9U8_9ALTE|nr:monovalent cation:proton antiporter-2 (CPA2) family protein [Alteromonas aquimaris]MCW8109558.1 monovalent cation:proton antiporter-2 (CPA2) family protein [Alteromonas aquimaris]